MQKIWAQPSKPGQKKGPPWGQTSNITTYRELREVCLVTNIHRGLLPER
jgi:hypothetical protein